MAVFRRFLESCPARLGAAQDLLPFYALPYVLDPPSHPSFSHVFQDSWVSEVRERLSSLLARYPPAAPRPSIFGLLHKQPSSVGQVAAVAGRETPASALRTHRALRRRLQLLQDDYHKLIGVAWELSKGLEGAVTGERVDLEGTLAACTHRYPELFSLTLTHDTTAGPATILKESMERCRSRPSLNAPLPALDFGRVRIDLGGAPETHVLLLLQALRQRITRVTSGSVRQAVVTAFVRGDVVGLRGGYRSWARLAGALSSPQPRVLGQAVARLVNALTAFSAGRAYLATEEVCGVLLAALKGEPLDPTTGDMTLAALQKLSIRPEVQEWLVAGGAVEWLACTLQAGHTLPTYTQEYAAALLMNLTLRSAGRERCLPLSPTLLPALTRLLPALPAHVVPYITGALFSLLSHPDLRQHALDTHLDDALEHLAKVSDTDQRKQLEYIVDQLRRDPAPSPPPSPNQTQDVEEDPEWLEEELEAGDPVKAPPHAPVGEELLAWRYTLHPGETDDEDRKKENFPPTRSAPAPHMEPRPHTPTLRRPHSDNLVIRTPRLQKEPQAEAGWDYPADDDDTFRRRVAAATAVGGGGGGGGGGGSWCERRVKEWSSPPPPLVPPTQDPRNFEHVTTPASESEAVGRIISVPPEAPPAPLHLPQDPPQALEEGSHQVLFRASRDLADDVIEGAPPLPPPPRPTLATTSTGREEGRGGGGEGEGRWGGGVEGEESTAHGG
ncbi:lisH domain-containing protein ARMC9-like isoform X2 [Scylla paramamosain]|uniref:lisH domain-containing protein ARMC9-like isoform X2 n=1 Tax=Scylla paramamosain TaxID=85552 RepID=UPI003082C0DC